MIEGVPRLIGPSGERIGYTSLSISRSLEQLASTASWQSHESVADRMVQPCEVRERTGRRLFRGFIEQQQGDEYRGFSGAARSLTSALVLTDALGTELFRRTTPLAILRTLATRAGVPMAAGAAPTARVSRFRLERGESFAKALQRLAETYRFIVTDDASGQLRGYRPPERATATWTEGRHPVVGPVGVSLDFADWRDEWVCRGQREVVTPDLADDEAAQLRVGITTGARRASRRVLPNKSAVSKADAARFVEWQARKELASAVRVEVSLADWPAGIDAGARVRVRVPRQNIDNEFIVARIGLEVSGSTFTATASCVFPEVYSFRPLRGQVERRVDTWKLNDGPVQVVRPL